MSILSSLNVPSDMEQQKDSLPPASLPRILDTGIYDVVIDTAYIDTSAGGATSVNFVFKLQDGRELRSQQWITSGEAKGRLPYYVRDGKKIPLPGFSIANAICLLSAGEELQNMDHETKVLSLYDYDARKEVPQQKEVIMDLIGKEVTLGVQKVVEDKRAKSASGSYEPTGETRLLNEIDSVFRTRDGFTVSEIRDGKSEPEHKAKWSTTNTADYVRDKSVAKKGHVTGDSAPAKTDSVPFAGDKPKNLFS